MGPLPVYLSAIALLSVAATVVLTLRFQRSTAIRQLFESKFFTLLQLHRDNVREIELAKANGRKFFVAALRELRAIYPIAREAADHCGQQLTRQQILHAPGRSSYASRNPASRPADP
jgi:hypothetical protein